MFSTSAILLTLFIIALGTAFGAGLYETCIILPKWFPKSEPDGYTVDVAAMLALDSGRKFWAMVTTGPLTILTLINLFLASQSAQPVHNWWVAAALITFFERLGTFTFFIPTAIKLQKSNVSASPEINRTIKLWITLNSVRCVLNLTGWILAIETLALYI